MDCNNSHLPLEWHLNNMLRHSGNLNGIPMVDVGAVTHTDNALSCDLSHLSFDDLLKKSIGIDSCGKPAIRVKFINSCTQKVDCNLNAEQSHFNSMFAYDKTLQTFALVINKSV